MLLWLLYERAFFGRIAHGCDRAATLCCGMKSTCAWAGLG